MASSVGGSMSSGIGLIGVMLVLATATSDLGDGN
jgi:hypothetical protein